MTAYLLTGLGWALVHFVWQGALIGLLLAVALTVFRGARWRYGMAAGAMALMATCFAITAALSLPNGGVGASVRFLAVEGARGAASGMPVAPDAGIAGLFPWMVPFWAAGVLVLGLLRLGGWTLVQRMRRRGTCAAPVEWQRRLAELARLMGASPSVRLLESSLAEVPVVIGFARPVILVPAGLLAGLPVWQLEAILLHELAHVRRFDYAVNLLQSAIESLPGSVVGFAGDAHRAGTLLRRSGG